MHWKFNDAERVMYIREDGLIDIKRLGLENRLGKLYVVEELIKGHEHGKWRKKERERRKEGRGDEGRRR